LEGGEGEQQQPRGGADGEVQDDDVDPLLVPLISNNGLHHASPAVVVAAELADPEDPRK
jgi:hypothetical protein